MAPLDDQQQRIFARRRIVAARLAVEQGDLAEYLAGADDVQRHFLAVARDGADANAAAQHRHHRGAVVAALEDGLAAADAALRGELQNLVEFLRSHGGEQRAAQQGGTFHVALKPCHERLPVPMPRPAVDPALGAFPGQYARPGINVVSRTAIREGDTMPGLDDAIRYALAHETPWPRDLRAHLEAGFFEPPPHNEILGPIRPRGAPNGLILRGGSEVARWGDTRQVDFTFSVGQELSQPAGRHRRGRRIDSGPR